MNTTEVKKKVNIHTFKDLYKFAKKQFLIYEKLEGVIPESTDKAWEDYDFSIDCADDQKLFKDMIQIRFIEELTEATKACDENNLDHFLEELTDAVNFFLSAYVMLGIDLNNLKSPSDYLVGEKSKLEGPPKIPEGDWLYVELYNVVEATGYLCNLLKNRPWSQSNYLVSMTDFNERLEELWETFWGTLGYIGISPDDLFDMFARKFSVNLYRIETGY